MSEEHTAKEGEIICVTSGEYSDFSIHGFYIVLKDFRTLQELDSYLEENPEQREDYAFKESQFLSWLHLKGLLIERDTLATLHLGNYSTSKGVTFHPALNPKTGEPK